jgi:HlyD family secretion protein
MISITGFGGEPRTLIYVVDGAYAVEKEVKTGIQDNAFIEIISGTEKGAQVISAPFSAISKKLADSTLIEIVPKEDLFKTDKKK